MAVHVFRPDRRCSEKFTITDGIIGFIAGPDLEYVGYVIVELFVVTWAIALAVWRFDRIEERWSAKLQQAELA